MGFKDTFEFSESEYAAEISDSRQYPDSRLKTQEIVKCRQHISASASIGGGVGLAPFTFGLSLLGSAYGARRLYIAKKKLELIQAELDKRQISRYEPTKRDFFIPMGISLGTLGLGAGLDTIAVHATSQIASHAVADHGTRAVTDVLSSPSNFCHGVEAGVSLQVHEVASALTGASAANLDSFFIISGAPYMAPGALVGLSVGIGGAHLAETKLAQYASGKVAFRVIDRFLPKKSQAITTRLPPQQCKRRSQVATGLMCEHCEEHIDRKHDTYYHCCQCGPRNGTDDYDGCQRCVETLMKGCKHQEKHVLYKITPQHSISCNRLNEIWLKLPATALVCSICFKRISEEDYYHCCLCCDDDFDLCRDCHEKGKRCPESTHTIMVMLPEPRKNCLKNTDETPLPKSCVRFDSPCSSPITCNGCWESFEPSEMGYLHCCDCSSGVFDLCIMCLIKNPDLRCSNPKHKNYFVRPKNT